MIGFIQPFGINAFGGGARILRALLACPHPDALSINTAVSASPAPQGIREVHIPVRTSFGRLERTRIAASLGALDGLLGSHFRSRLRSAMNRYGITLLHIVAHDYSAVQVWRVAADLKIPYFVSVHDDVSYTTSGHPLRGQMLSLLAQIWKDAAGVFVISKDIGEEYSARYGSRDYAVVTDGLKAVPELPVVRHRESLRVYFMGLCHVSYGANFRALLDALNAIRLQNPSWQISLTCRSEFLSCRTNQQDVEVEILPFAHESEVQKDFESADILYQPLPFDAAASAFSRFSLSTKMITYLGSGLPIFYHGPKESAAFNCLSAAGAAVTCTSLDRGIIAAALTRTLDRREQLVGNALNLARTRFMLDEQQLRFWKPISAVLSATA